LAIIVSMEASITLSVLMGAGLYLGAAMALPWSMQDRAGVAADAPSDSSHSAAASV
jgi:hypothetical protein